MIAVILAVSRFIMVRQNFRRSFETAVNQNHNQNILEKYHLESSLIQEIQKGEEITNEKIVEQMKSLYSYMENSMEKVAVYTENKELVFSNFEKIENLTIEPLFSQETDQYCLQKIENQHYMLFSEYWSINNEVIYVIHIYDITAIYKEREIQIKEIMYADSVILVIASLFVFIFSKYLTRPIEKLNVASKKISKGNFKERVSFKTNDEIGELASSFNRMADEIEVKIESLNQSLQAKDDFVTGFSHEIKTPMTAIMGYADLLRLKKCDEQIMAKALHYIYWEAKRLEELSYKMLSLMELSEERIEFKETKIKEFIEKISAEILLENIELKLDLEDAIVEIDENLMEVVIRNLLQNAKKAEPKDNAIIIQGKVLENQKYRISVIDKGIGIPQEHIHRVTQDFYRVDKARSKQNGGTGIGLSLCKKILELHHTILNIESGENVGTTVSFELEVNKNEE